MQHSGGRYFRKAKPSMILQSETPVLFAPTVLFVIMGNAREVPMRVVLAPRVIAATERGYDFRFEALTDEVFPNGNYGFSGLLVREGKLWKARAFIATTWATPAESQKQAVENCIEDAVKLFAEDEARKLRLDAEIERQRLQVAELNKRLRENSHASVAKLTEKPAINSIVLKDLSKSEIKKFFDVVVESFKREVNVLPK
jgi:hypothetical protein